MFVYISNSLFGQVEILESDNFDRVFTTFQNCSKDNSPYQTCYIVIVC